MELSLTTPTLSLPVSKTPTLQVISALKTSTPTNPAPSTTTPQQVIPLIEESPPAATAVVVTEDSKPVNKNDEEQRLAKSEKDTISSETDIKVGSKTSSSHTSSEKTGSVIRFTRHRRNHSRGQSVSKVELPSDLEESLNMADSNNSSTDNETNHTSISPSPAVVEQSNIEEQSSTVSSNNVPSIHSPTAASARPHSVIGHIKSSMSFDATEDHTSKHPVIPIQNRGVSSAKEPVTRKISAPPIHLMNLFEPLPGKKLMPTVVAVDTDQPRPARPHSEYILPPATVSHQKSPVSGTLSSIPSIATTKSSAHETTPNVTTLSSTKHSSRPSISQCKSSSMEYSTEEDPTNKQPNDSHKSDTSYLSADTSSSSVESTHIIKMPSHPDLRPSSIKSPFKFIEDNSPIIRARSVTQLQSEESDSEELLYKRRSYSGGPREGVAGYSLPLTKDNAHFRGSLDKLRGPPPVVNFATTTTRLPLSHQNSPIKESLRRRISADPERERVHSAPGSRLRNIRPRSMFETGSAYNYGGAIDLSIATAADVLGQLFWASVSLLLSDYETEFSLALRLFDNVVSKLDLSSDVTYVRLEAIFTKTKWVGFPGIIKMLLKGLTLVSTTHMTHQLISKLCSHVNRQIFDPTGVAGLPLCIVALLPELVLHFESRTERSIETASNIAKV